MDLLAEWKPLDGAFARREACNHAVRGIRGADVGSVRARRLAMGHGAGPLAV